MIFRLKVKCRVGPYRERIPSVSRQHQMQQLKWLREIGVAFGLGLRTRKLERIQLHDQQVHERYAICQTGQERECEQWREVPPSEPLTFV